MSDRLLLRHVRSGHEVTSIALAVGIDRDYVSGRVATVARRSDSGCGRKSSNDSRNKRDTIHSKHVGGGSRSTSEPGGAAVSGHDSRGRVVWSYRPDPRWVRVSPVRSFASLVPGRPGPLVASKAWCLNMQHRSATMGVLEARRSSHVAILWL